MHQARDSGLPPEEASWQLQAALVERLETIWCEPDRGIWEVRHGNEQFTHSKVMAWVAFDRAIRAVETYGYPAPLERWRAIRKTIHDTVCREAFNEEVGGFTRTLGGKELDAATLLIPIVGFLSATDERVLRTVKAIEQRLMRNGFVLRYDSGAVRDGLPSGEGAFLPCTLWYADNLVMQGRRAKAEAVLERVLEAANDVGLLPEELDFDTGEHLGNFPQALSHLSLVNTAHNLARADGPAQRRSQGSNQGK